MTDTTLQNKMTIQRKVVGYGYSKLVVLPKYWVEMAGIKKGDAVTMQITKSGNLLVYGGQNESE